jgi:hypothetical protein
MSLLLSLLFSAIAVAAEDVSRTIQPQTQHTRRGPVELTVTLDRATAQIAEPLTLTLTVQAPIAVTISLPRQQSARGRFNVLNVTDTPDIPTDHGRLYRSPRGVAA